MTDKWDRWCKKTRIKHEKHKEEKRPVETAVQVKLDKKKKLRNT